MHGRRSTSLVIALALSALALGALTQAASAASRAPLRDLLGAPSRPAVAFDSAARPNPATVRALTHRSTRRRPLPASGAPRIFSTTYGATELESIAATLRSLDHGPELAQLVVYVATPAEVGEACGAEVVACYVPSEAEMVVSGVDRPVGGVPRDFAIAHEYGHHLANSRQGGSLPAIEAGTVRWATYERVCQLTRRGRLFPGNQGAHYWQDPEEAFAQSYADLNRPGAGVSWQFTPLLRPTTASLSKIHADVVRPYSGPVTSSWSASLSAPPAAIAERAATASSTTAVGAGHAVGEVPWVGSRLIRTPLDGSISVSLRSTAGAPLEMALRDPVANRVLARAATDGSGDARLSYANCGHAALRLDVHSAAASAAAFEATITRP